MANIPDGFGIIAGRGRENAQKALAAAEAAGVDVSEVRTVAEGYLVPDAVIKKFHASAKSAEKSEEPKKAPAAKKAPAKKPAEEPAQEAGSEAEAETEEKG